MADKIDHRERAAKIWPVLVEHAKARTKLTYAELSAKVGIRPLSLKLPLDEIHKHCSRNSLPPLTILVVNADTGRPGPGFTAWPADDFDNGLEVSCSFAWDERKNPFALFMTR